MAIPWTATSVPHATLDVLRGCNIQCPGCYNRQAANAKPLQVLRAELRQLLAMRRLGAVTLIGGEPTLHPQLCEIVHEAAAQGLQVALLTNGALIEPRLLRALKQAGLSLVWLHIQGGQVRNEIPADAEASQWRQLRQTKARSVAEQGLTVGYSLIAYRSRLSEVAEVVRETASSPWVHFLLVTEFQDVSRWGPVRGDLLTGMRQVGESPGGDAQLRGEEVTHRDILPMMGELGWEPFAHLGSSADVHDPRWLTYVLGAVQTRSGRVESVALRAALSDRLAVRLWYRSAGRHTYYERVPPALFRCQLLANALSGGRGVATLRLVLASCRRRATLHRKWMTFQQGPSVTPDGHVECCRHCPDATIRHGRLVPVCLADLIEPDPPASRGILSSRGVL